MRGGGAGRGGGWSAAEGKGRARDRVWMMWRATPGREALNAGRTEFAFPPPPCCPSSHYQPLSEFLGIRVKLGTNHEGEMKERGF